MFLSAQARPQSASWHQAHLKTTDFEPWRF